MGTAVLRVLLAENGFTDTDAKLRSLCADIGQTLELFFVSTRITLSSALRDFHPDVSFLALSLLQPDPPGTVRSLHLAVPDVPFILFADPADSEVAVQCLLKGSGMGLATVYGIAKQHNGFIHVHSEPKEGSLFRVYLPALEAAFPEGASDSQDCPPISNLHGTETILIAEDHDSIREMVRQTLVGFGYRVLSASNGEEALRLSETETPALAILDVIMPRLGGPATAVKLLARAPGLPILFTSGYSETAESFRSLPPSSRYLQKPYSPTALGRTVREILDSPLPQSHA
jgi:CheY-like chemotaxis protein